MVALGRANGRMKDFYDIWLLSQSFPFGDDRLAREIAATFERRETEIPAELPVALTPAFAAADWGMSGAVALAGFLVISLKKWFRRQKEGSSEGGERT